MVPRILTIRSSIFVLDFTFQAEYRGFFDLMDITTFMEQEEIPQYDHQPVEAKWQAQWEADNLYKADAESEKPKFYALDTFVYPSGSGVTIGHYKSFGGMDVIARYKRMKGFNVLYPTGWDTLGLPAENYAIKTGRHPRDITNENIATYIRQYKAAGLSYDWSTEINTAEPEYYKWTQWLFLVMYKHGLAYQKVAPVQWCDTCKTVIAKEQVVDGDKCERCGSTVMVRDLKQWFFKVSNYADRLGKDIEKLDWAEKNKNPHRKWIEQVHDWCVSRQRYWGPPIPIIYCDSCGTVPVPENQLPVELPYDVDYVPTGESPLAKNPDFINTTCPQCGGAAKREADILDTFVSSAWYQFRFTDPKNPTEFASKEALAKWCPVDHYEGTIEHLTAHLVYARFVTKVLFDNGYLAFDEPFPKYTPVGLLVDKGGTKFSKRLGNAPDTNMLIDTYGGDLLRLSCYFISPFEDVSKWGVEDIVGVKKFRDRVWRLAVSRVDGSSHDMPEEITRQLHVMVKSVSEAIEQMRFNVALSGMMIFIGELQKYEGQIDRQVWQTFIKVFAPFAPFISEEMWSHLGNSGSVHGQEWPSFDANYTHSDDVEIAVQFDGKTRGSVVVANNADQQAVIQAVQENKTLASSITEPYSLIYIPNRVINFVKIGQSN